MPKDVLEIHEAQPAEQPPPEEDLFGLEKEKQDEWDKIRELMPKVHVNEKSARSYFANVCDVSINIEELANEAVPQALTVHHLREFRQRLEQSSMNLG
ncbi:hypothetical protein ES703_112973 [subsurface metagenome]